MFFLFQNSYTDYIHIILIIYLQMNFNCLYYSTFSKFFFYYSILHPLPLSAVDIGIRPQFVYKQNPKLVFATCLSKLQTASVPASRYSCPSYKQLHSLNHYITSYTHNLFISVFYMYSTMFNYLSSRYFAN